MIGHETFGVFVSPYQRTMETMTEACKQLPGTASFVHQDPRLREQDYGPLRPAGENKELRENRKIHGRFFYRFPGGESCADIFDRISMFLETYHRRSGLPGFPENILIFTHGTAMTCFLMRWYHWDYECFEATPPHPPNCHIIVLKKTGSDDYKVTEPFYEYLSVQKH